MELLTIENNGNAKELSYTLANQVIKSVLEGNSNPLKQLIMVKSLESALSEIKDKVLPLGLEELAKYGKEVEMNGYRISVINAGAKYDYSDCNHPVYHSLVAKMDELKKEIADIEKFLKSLKSPIEVLDKETGEVYTIYPPVYSSKETLKFI
jgi:hypothetical protein